jgi:hypothetical protein
LDLYSFLLVGKLLLFLLGQLLAFGLVLKFLDLLALVDDGLDDVVAKRVPALNAFYSGNRLADIGKPKPPIRSRTAQFGLRAAYFTLRTTMV